MMGNGVMGDNASSQCFYIKLWEDGEALTLMLTGDVEKEGERQLIDRIVSEKKGTVDVLKVAHHGSAYSSSMEFLELIAPKVAVISCGSNNSYGHPHKETLERLTRVNSKILTTTQYGAITIKLTKNGWKVYGYCAP